MAPGGEAATGSPAGLWLGGVAPPGSPAGKMTSRFVSHLRLIMLPRAEFPVQTDLNDKGSYLSTELSSPEVRQRSGQSQVSERFAIMTQPL